MLFEIFTSNSRKTLKIHEIKYIFLTKRFPPRSLRSSRLCESSSFNLTLIKDIEQQLGVLSELGAFARNYFFEY